MSFGENSSSNLEKGKSVLEDASKEDLIKQIKRQVALLQKSKQKSDELRQKNSELATELSSCQKECKELRERRDELEDKQKVFENNAKMYKSDIEQMECMKLKESTLLDTLKTMQEEICMLSAENKILKSKESELEVALKEMNDLKNVASKDKEFQLQIADLQAQLKITDDLTIRIKAKDADLEKINSENRNLHDKCKSLDDKILAKEKDFHLQELELKQLLEIIDNLNKSLEEKDRDIKIINSENQQLQDKSKEMYVKDLETKENFFKLLQEKGDELKRVYSDTPVKTLEDEETELHSLLIEKENFIKMLQEKDDELKQVHFEYQQLHDKEMSVEHLENGKMELQSLQKEKENFLKMLQEKDDELKQFCSENLELQDKYKEVISVNDSIKTKELELQEALKRINSENLQLLDKCADAVMEVETSNKLHKSILLEKENLIKMLEEKNNELKRLNLENERLLTKCLKDKKLNELTDEIKAKEKEIHHLQMEKGSLIKMLEDKDDDLKKLNLENQHLNESYKEVTHQNMLLNKLKENFEAKEKEFQIQFINLQRLLVEKEELEKNVNDIQKLLEEKDEVLNKMNLENEQLHMQCKEVAFKVVSMEECIESFKAKENELIGLKMECKRLTGELKEITKEKNMLNDALVDSKHSTTKYEEMEDLLIHLEDMQNQNIMLQAELQNTASERDQLLFQENREEQCSALEEQIQNLESELDDVRSKLEGAEFEAEELKAKMEELSENNDIRTEYEALKRQEKFMREFLADVLIPQNGENGKENDVIVRIVQLKNNLSDTQAEVEKLSFQLHDKNVEMLELQEKISNSAEIDSRNQKELLENEFRDFDLKHKEEIVGLVAAIASLKASLKEKVTEVESYRRNIEEMQMNLQKVMEESSSLKEAEETERTLNETLKNHVDRLEMELKILKSSYVGEDVKVELENARELLSVELEDAKVHVAQLESKLTELTVERNELLQRPAIEDFNTLTKTFEKTCASLEEEIKLKIYYKDELEKNMLEFASVRAQLMNMKAEKDCHNSEFQALLADKKETVTNLNDKVCTVTFERDQANQKVDELSNENKILKESLRLNSLQLEQEKERHEKSIAHAELLQQQLKQQKLMNLEFADYERLVDQLNQQIKKLEDEKQQLKDEIKQKEEMLEGVRVQMSQVETQKQKIDERSVKMKQLLVKTKKELAEIKNQEIEKTKKESELQIEVELCRQKVEVLQVEIASITSQKEKLQEILSTTKDSQERVVRSLKSRLNATQADLAAVRQNYQDCRNDYDNYKVRVHSVLKQQKNKSSPSHEVDLSEKMCLEKAMDQLKLKLQEISEQMTALKIENETLLDEQERLHSKISIMTEEIQRKEDEFKDRLESASVEKKVLQNRHLETVRQLRQENEALISTYVEQIRSLREENDRNMNDLREQLQYKELEIKRCQHETKSSGDEGDVFDVINTERQEGEGSENTDQTLGTPVQFSCDNVIPPEFSLEQLLNPKPASLCTNVSEEYETLEQQMISCTKKVDHLTELLNESEATNIRLAEQTRVLKEEIRRLERNQEREEHTANMEYLKNIILKFLSLTGGSERERLVPVLTMMLKLSPEEKIQLSVVAKGDNQPPVEGENVGWGSYLPRWSGIV